MAFSFVKVKDFIVGNIKVKQFTEKLPTRGDNGIYYHSPNGCTVINNAAIIWIPKNASSLLREVDKTYYDYSKVKVNEYWAILRDPYQRWKSGACEFLLRYPEHSEYFYDNISKIEFDAHTAPQLRFLPINEKINLVTLEGRGLEILHSRLNLFAKFGGIDNVPTVNSSLNHQKSEIFKQLDQVIDRNLVKLIEEYYYDDMQLYSKVVKGEYATH